MKYGRKKMNVALGIAIGAAFVCGLSCILRKPKK